MIQLKNLTPHVYSDQSRDFQFIERLFDIVLNSAKTNCDTLYNLPAGDNADPQLISLTATTLGFKSRHHYNNKQLKALCSCFSEALRYKGTMHALDIVGKALLNAEGITDQMYIEKTEDDKYAIDVYVPQKLSDTNLLEDAFDYLLPAGMSYNVIRELHLEKAAETTLFTNDKVTVYDNNTGTKDAVTSVVAEKTNVEELNASVTTGTELKNIPGTIGNMTVVQPK